MRIGVLGFNLTSADREQIIKMLNAMEIIGTISIHDTRSSSTNLDNIDVVITLGLKAILVVKSVASSKKIPVYSLPDIKGLYPTDKGGDIGDRAKAAEVLTSLKTALKENKLTYVEDAQLLESVRAKDIPPLSVEQLKSLRSELEKMERLYWRCRSEDDKIICISLQPLDKDVRETVKADIYLTFNELIMLRVAMDVFKINEVSLAKSQQELQSNEGPK